MVAETPGIFISAGHVRRFRGHSEDPEDHIYGIICGVPVELMSVLVRIIVYHAVGFAFVRLVQSSAEPGDCGLPHPY